MTMDARLGYRDKGDPITNWTEIARSSEERVLKCNVQKVRNYIYVLKLPFFLGVCVYLK